MPTGTIVLVLAGMLLVGCLHQRHVRRQRAARRAAQARQNPRRTRAARTAATQAAASTPRRTASARPLPVRPMPAQPTPAHADAGGTLPLQYFHAPEADTPTPPTPPRARVTGRTAPVHNGEIITYYAAASSAGEDNRYQFLIRREGNGRWRAYIQRTPSYGERDDGPAISHWLTDPVRGKYVCLAGSDPTDMNVLLEKTMCWADRTQRYIRTGKNMNEP